MKLQFQYLIMTWGVYVFINLFFADSNICSGKGANLCKIQVTSSINPFNILGKIDRKMYFKYLKVC